LVVCYSIAVGHQRWKMCYSIAGEHQRWLFDIQVQSNINIGSVLFK